MTLLELLQLMRKHLKLMIVLPIVCALATAVVCFVALPNTYISKMVLSILKNEKTTKGSLNMTRLKAGWDEEKLTKLLEGSAI